MRPTSIAALVSCSILVLSAFIIAICSDLNFFSLNFWLVLIKNSGPLAALAFAFIHYLQSRPIILKFVNQHWQVLKAEPTWKEVSITILASTHKKGKNPTVTFINRDEFSNSQSRLIYKIEENGDILIRHDPNRFMPPWEEFAVKITM